MNMRWCTGALLAFAVSTAPATAAEYRMLTSWDKSNPVPLLAEGFAKNVEAASKGNIKFVLSGPETVPPFEQLQPVAAGAFQMLFTHGIYHYGQTGLSTGLDAVRGTFEERRGSGLFEALDKHYQKIGIKVVAVALSAKTGYAFALKTRSPPTATSKARRSAARPPIIRSSACSAARRWCCRSRRSTPRWRRRHRRRREPVVGLLGVRWHEVAKYLAQPSFGFTHQLFLMNLATWNRLSDADKKLLLDEGRKIEEVWYREYDRMADAEIKADRQGRHRQSARPQQAKLDRVWSEGCGSSPRRKARPRPRNCARSPRRRG